MSQVYLIPIIFGIIVLLICTFPSVLTFFKVENVSHHFLWIFPLFCAQYVTPNNTDTSLARAEDIGKEKENEFVDTRQDQCLEYVCIQVIRWEAEEKRRKQSVGDLVTVFYLDPLPELTKKH